MQNNKVMTVYAARCTGDAKNCLYPIKVDLTDYARMETLKELKL